MKNARLYYSEQGWIIDVPFALTPIELQKAINYHKKIQTERIRLMQGDKRKACEVALNSLSIFNLKQNVQPNEWNEHLLVGR